MLILQDEVCSMPVRKKDRSACRATVLNLQRIRLLLIGSRLCVGSALHAGGNLFKVGLDPQFTLMRIHGLTYGLKDGFCQ
jgi:hypothetical protein